MDFLMPFILLIVGLTTCDSQIVKTGKFLNPGEENYVNGRKPIIKKCLQEHGIDTKNGFPKIAVLGSGGGQRAMVALLGTLDQMEKDNLLNSSLYLMGISGSTWCMSSLYKNPKWSTELASMKDKVVKRLSSEYSTYTNGLNWLTKVVENPNYSLTDAWAAAYVLYIVKQVDESHLSEQGRRSPVNPYPIYTVIDKGLKQGGDDTSCWFELSPHAAGYTNLDVFVNTSLYGSKFLNGHLVEKVDEMDMLYLQGMCGSALADGDAIIQHVKDKIKGWINKKISWLSPFRAEAQQNIREHRILKTLIQLDDCYEDNKKSSHLLQTLMALQPAGIQQMTIQIIQRDEWLQKTPAQRKQYLTDLSYLFCRFFKTLKKLCDLYRKTTKLHFLNWGTQFNLLHKMPLKGVPKNLLQDETRHLIDAGLLLNSPFIPALRKERKVNLIISFDFSDGDPFQTVRKAQDICKKAGIPFPHVQIPSNDIDNPKGFYIFQDKSNTAAPVVIHIPLFNTANVGGKVKKWRDDYTTVQRAYDKTMIENLLKVSAMNVKINKQRILDAIRAASK